MKYCNRCFRNINEDVAVCPHCGMSDKLVDYTDKSNRSGEAFSCNNSFNEGLSSHIKDRDVYSIKDDENEELDAYGNKAKPKHSIDNCENSAENLNETISNSSDNLNQTMSRKIQLQNLSPEERRRLIEEKQKLIKRPLNQQLQQAVQTIDNSSEQEAPMVLKLVAFFFAFSSPFISVIISIVLSIKYPANRKFFRGCLIFSIIWYVCCISFGVLINIFEQMF